MFDKDESNFVYNIQQLSPYNPKVIKIMFWNINGLNAVLKKDQFLHFIKAEKYDIICFNETKLTMEKLLKEKFHKNEIWNE